MKFMFGLSWFFAGLHSCLAILGIGGAVVGFCLCLSVVIGVLYGLCLKEVE